MIEAEELDADKIDDAFARRVFWVHLEATQSGFSSGQAGIVNDLVEAPNGALTACYKARFNFYGVIGSPHLTGCPGGAEAIVPTPLPSQPPGAVPHLSGPRRPVGG